MLESQESPQRDAETSEEAPRSRSRKTSWRLVSAVGILVVAIAGGAFFIRQAMGDTETTAAENETGDQDTAKDAKSDDGDKGDKGDKGAEKKDREKKAPIPVSVSELTTGDISAYISTTANLVAEDEVKVLAEAEGRVESVRVEEGQLVDKGQILATLVRGDQEIAVSKAEVKETNARLAHERGQKLFAEELLSQEDLDKLQVDYEIARQELAEAQWVLTKTVIRSPFSGRVSERIVQTGQHVRPGDELFQITDFNPLIARIYLPERDVLGLEPGREVRISLNADEAVHFAGRIRQISPVVDTTTGTVKVTVEANSPPRSVRPGSFVTIDIIRETRVAAVRLPREAVLRELQKAHVFVEVEGQVVKRSVSLGLEEGGWIEALSGVDAGDRVIVAGQGGLKDGAAVKVLSSTAKERS